MKESGTTIICRTAPVKLLARLLTVAAFATNLAGLGCHRARVYKGGSSIVKVHGGSILGEDDVDGWKLLGTIGNTIGYSAYPSGTNDWINTNGFQNNVTNVKQTGGWKIEISSSEATSEVTDALILCSDFDPPLCAHPLTVDGNGLVYLFPYRPSISKLLSGPGNYTISFHNTTAGCDGPNAISTTDSTCDQIVSATITTTKNVFPDPILGDPGHMTNIKKLICQAPGSTPTKPCSIWIGN